MEGKNVKPKRGKNIVLRLLALLVTVALVLGAVALVVFRDQLNIDALRRWFTYRTLERSDSGQAESFYFDGDLTDTFRNLDGDLLVCSSNAICLYSGSGTRYINQSVTMSQPAVSVWGNTAVVYDAGGTSLYVIRERAIVHTITEGATILSASMDQSGSLVVVTHESGYRGVVTVYNKDFTPQVSLRLSSRFILDGVLSGGGDLLAVVTAGQSGGSFVSALELYDLDQSQTEDLSPSAQCDLGGAIPLGLEVEDSTVWVLGDTGLTVSNGRGEAQGTLDWSDRYIKNFSLDGDGFAAVLLGKYRAGSQAELAVADKNGTITASMEVNEQVLSLSAAGRYLAVLTADRLDIYTQDLTLYASLSGTKGARKVLLREDGSAMLIGVDYARLYVPD